MRLKDKRILVTGGTHGIGRAITRAILAEGAAGVVVATEQPEPHDWAELEAAGPVCYQQADLATEEAPGALVAHAVAQLGGLDGLVHCAGIYIEGEPGDFSEVDLWNFTVNVKARGGYLLAGAFAKVASEGASFIGVTSINAEQSEPAHLAYDPACAALGGVIRAFAVHHAPKLRFNGLAPGLIATRLTQAVTDDPALHAQACKNIPMRRIGNPEDCTGAALFLLSDESRYITGETIFVDGGIRANQMSSD